MHCGCDKGENMARAGLGRLLLSSLPAYRLRLGDLVVLKAVQAIALLLLPTINGAMIDHGVLARDVGYIKVSGSVMVAVTVVQVCALLGAIRLATFVGVAVARDLRERVFTGVLRFAPQTVAEYGVPGLTAPTLLEDRLGARSGHPVVLRQRGPWPADPRGGETHRSTVGGAVRAAVVVRTVAAPRRSPC